MEHLDEILDKIRNSDISDKQKIDKSLEHDRDIRDLGKVFTKLQKSDARKQSQYIYKYIGKFGKEGRETSNLLLKTVDN